MQVPVVMTTALGQKISTVAVQQPTGATGTSSHTTLLTNTPAVGAATGNASQQQKVRKRILQLPLYLRTDPDNG